MRKVKMVVLIGLAALGAVYAGTRPEQMNREQKNKLLVKVAMQAINANDWEGLRELYSPKFIQHQPGNSKKTDWARFELACRNVKSWMPTLRIEIEDIIAEGDKVAIRTKKVVTYKEKKVGYGNGPGKVEFTEMDMFRIEGGKIVEEWCEFDMASTSRKFHKLRNVKTWR